MLTKFYNISTDTKLGGDNPSDYIAVSQSAIKKYIDRLVLGGSCVYYRDALPTTSSLGTVLTIPRVHVGIGDSWYNGSGTLNINDSGAWDNAAYATAANRAGVDCYLYACQPATDTDVPKFLLSTNATVPTGYTATNSRKLGGFHGLCLAVGTISGHKLSGWATGSILPASIWDLYHRSCASTEGTIYCNGKWADIYLAGWDGTSLVSKYGASVADGSTAITISGETGFSGEALAEYATYVHKALVSRMYYMGLAEGSNQRTNIKDSKDWGTAGGHYDTAGRRMISNYGAEDCCGFMWQWCSDLFDSGATWYDSLQSNKVIQNPDGFYTANKYISNRLGWREESVYEGIRSTVGALPTNYATSGRGSAYSALIRRLRVGGRWGDGSSCGSRSVFGSELSSHRAGDRGARLVSEPWVGGSSAPDTTIFPRIA